jgi:hypothetical protein
VVTLGEEVKTALVSIVPKAVVVVEREQVILVVTVAVTVTLV